MYMQLYDVEELEKFDQSVASISDAILQGNTDTTYIIHVSIYYRFCHHYHRAGRRHHPRHHHHHIHRADHGHRQHRYHHLHRAG